MSPSRENKFFRLFFLLTLAGMVLAVSLAAPGDYVTWPVKQFVLTIIGDIA